MKSVVRSWLLLLLVGGLPSYVYGQTPMDSQEKMDLSRLGPQVGEKVPDFSLRDQTGRVRTLESVMGPKGVMLVFYRSADW